MDVVAADCVCLRISARGDVDELSGNWDVSDGPSPKRNRAMNSMPKRRPGQEIFQGSDGWMFIPLTHLVKTMHPLLYRQFNCASRCISSVTAAASSHRHVLRKSYILFSFNFIDLQYSKDGTFQREAHECACILNNLSAELIFLRIIVTFATQYGNLNKWFGFSVCHLHYFISCPSSAC